MTRFAASAPSGEVAQQPELLLRTGNFKPAADLVGLLLQQAAGRIDAA